MNNANGCVTIDGNPWHKTPIRKRVRCKRCGKAIKVNVPAYRPLGNQHTRLDRICVPCGEKPAT